MNLSDRQAEEAIRRWLELLQEMRLNSFDAGHALKRAFFSQWLKPSSPPTASEFSPLPRYAKHFVAANMVPQGPGTASVLILRAGHTDRELLNTGGVSGRLNGLNVATASPSPDSFRRLAGISRILKLQASHGRTVGRAARYLRRRGHLLSAVRQEFDLPAHFDNWFWLEIERALWRYFGARVVLERAQPRVLVSAGDNMPGAYPFHAAARQLGISSVVIQHGFIGQEWLHYPLWSNKVCVWGEVEREWYLNRNVPAEKIVVTGNPRGITNLPLSEKERIRQKLGCASNERLLIWFTTPHGGQWMDRFLTWLRHPAMKRPGFRIVLKLHPKERGSTYRHKVAKNIAIYAAADLDVKSAFVAADVVVHDHSSIGAEAHFCGQNVICAAVNPPYPDYYRSLIGPQHYVQSPDEMADIVSNLKAPTQETKESPCLKFGMGQADLAIADVIRSLL